MSVRLAIVVSTSLLSLASPALAQNASQLPNRPIRRAEVIGVVERQFKAMDANHDGIVTEIEFEDYRAQQQPAAGGLAVFEHVGSHWFEHADTAEDGHVTLAEAEAHPLHLFDIADVNRDGVVSVAEAKAATMLMSFAK